MGYNTEDKKEQLEVQKYDVIDKNDSTLVGDDNDINEGHDPETNESKSNDEDSRVNLNMCSAYTVSC